MLLYIRLLNESFYFALNALRVNKLRTILSLLGVTVGIFSIIAVLAAVDSMKKNIEDSLNGIDSNTIYLFKYSFGPSDIDRWKIEQFPNVSYDEYLYLKKNLSDVDKISFNFFSGGQDVKFEGNTANDVRVKLGTNEFFNIEPFEINTGRLFNETESNSGANVIVLGASVAQQLFGSINPIGKHVRLYGQKFSVIGVLKKQGQNMFGDSNDVSVAAPVNAIRKLYGDNSDYFMPIILIKPVKNVDIEEFKAELTQKLRVYRGMKPSAIDSFFINVISGFSKFIDEITGTLNIAGWCLSGFSLLVGGFGIANIMFVSVKERTNLIGIQKALGAKNRFILFQFLFEAIILSLIGGVVGMFLVWIITIGVTMAFDFQFVLSLTNVIIGSVVAILIGLVAGLLPAISASKLDPVEAIRSGM